MNCEWIGWCALKPEAQAAWVQAVFSIVGIFTAILVPWWQHWKASSLRAAEAKVRATGRAALLLKGTKELCARIDRSLAFLDAKQQAADGLAVPYVAIPQSVMDQGAGITELGDAGAHLLKAINHCLELRDLLSGDQLLFDSNVAPFESRLAAARWHAHAALAGIRELLE